MPATSFYATTPTAPEQDALLTSYLEHLIARNGVGFRAREERMANVFDKTDVRASLHVDEGRFNRNYGAFVEKDIPLEEVALLAFVKINAGEAYGVEVTSKARAHLTARDEPKYNVEKVITEEEEFHTRLLLGATLHFEGLTVGDAWRPAWPLRLLIGGLARFPPWMFHPVLLGSEISGVYSFNWLLNRIQTLFADDPGVRDSMEERLIDILVDEIGHIAYNRILIGERGMPYAKKMAGMVTDGQRVMTKEMVALGFDNEVMKGISKFDYNQLPDVVKQKAFFA